jgi:hypothetical protein
MQEPVVARVEPGFEAYYRHYLSLHQSRCCRWLHAGGLVAAAALVLWAVWSDTWWLLPLAPPLVYSFAFAGHFLFEGNRPATLRNPYLAFLSYWRMLWDTLTGRHPA